MIGRIAITEPVTTSVDHQASPGCAAGPFHFEADDDRR
jgi:hypothetical protein